MPCGKCHRLEMYEKCGSRESKTSLFLGSLEKFYEANNIKTRSREKLWVHREQIGESIIVRGHGIYKR